MSKLMLAAGVAALAIASPALADPKGEKGGKGGGKPAAAQMKKAERGGGKQINGRHAFAGMDDERKERGKPRAMRIDRDDKPAKGLAKQFRDEVKERPDGGDADRLFRRAIEARRDDGVRFAPRWDGQGVQLGFVEGCPPGLAKKANGCLPPGQAKKLVGTTLASGLMANTLAGPYRLWYRDDDQYLYRWDDDYIYRVRRDGGLIDALFPYANRDYYYYPVGAPYPADYNYYNVPYQYRSYYPDGANQWYRYGDGAIYRVDPQTQLIQGIVALLTGTPLSVGQPLPQTYGVYNVPLSYRSQYYDTPDAWYRYSDGYIYRVDPTTRLITAVIDAIV